jgi:two-component system, LytTR family, sensor kinase
MERPGFSPGYWLRVMRTGRPKPQIGYWICQSAGWLAYGLLCIVSTWVMEGKEVGYFLSALVLAFCGFLLTHLFRGLFLARGWLSLAPGSLVMRMVGAIPVLSLLHVLLGYLEAPLESYLVGRPATFEYANRHVDYLLVNFLFGFLTFGCWTSIYLGFHFLDERRRAEKESWRLAAALSRARLDALRAQVNPHFLFNALNSLRALIEENPARARDAVTRLASILRYSLSTDSDATVPFGIELDFVMDYLELELLRFEDRLTVTKRIQPETLERPIPPMLLQTLVENAVKYGVSQNPGSVELSIHAAIDPIDDRLRIWVENTGHLAPENSRSTGTGLRNARERLQRLFGGSAELQIAEDTPGRVRVAVYVPNGQPMGAGALPAS